MQIEMKSVAVLMQVMEDVLKTCAKLQPLFDWLHTSATAEGHRVYPAECTFHSSFFSTLQGAHSCSHNPNRTSITSAAALRLSGGEQSETLQMLISPKWRA